MSSSHPSEGGGGGEDNGRVVYWSAEEDAAGLADSSRPLRALFVSQLPDSAPLQPTSSASISLTPVDYQPMYSPSASQQRGRAQLWGDDTRDATSSPPHPTSMYRTSSDSAASSLAPYSSISSPVAVSHTTSTFRPVSAFAKKPLAAAPSLASSLPVLPAHDLPCPGEVACGVWWRWLSVLEFSWITPLLRVGLKRPLQHSDLWDTFTADHCDSAYLDFERGWDAEVQRAKRAEREPSLMYALLRVYGPTFLLVLLVYGYVVADTLLGPQFLNWLVEYSVDVSSGESVAPIDGYKYCLLMFGSLVLAALCRSAAVHINGRMFLRLRSALVSALYRKALRVASRYREDGKLNNMIASDIELLVVLSGQLLPLFSAPVIIGVGVWELYEQVGWSALVGLGIILASLPFSALLMRTLSSWSLEVSNATDKRIELTNEVMSGVKVVKYYAWERPFLEQLNAAREVQLKWLWKLLLASTLFFAGLDLVPLFVSLAVFGIYAGTGGDMTPAVVFTSLTLIAIIRTPFSSLSDGLGLIAHLRISMQRIGEFLNKPDIDPNRIDRLPYPGVQVNEAQFSWEVAKEADEGEEKEAADKAATDAASAETTANGDGTAKVDASSEMEKDPSAIVAELPTEDKDKSGGLKGEKEQTARKGAAPPILTNVSFSADTGELVLVIGAVGSGKSSLLCGLLGEVERTAGRVAVGGKIGYVPQAAFIINASLRDNILFGQDFDAARYQQCVTACALDADIAILPNGDLTEIGEKGLNLSGGQKQRISIARAAYMPGCSTVLLDDPLSAVDTHVSDHIFHRCLNGPAMGGRTRVLITHSMAYVHHADRIVMMKETATPDSYTVKVGTAASLLADDEQFVSLMETYNRGREQIKGGAVSDGDREQAQHEASFDDADTDANADASTSDAAAEKRVDVDSKKSAAERTAAGNLVEVEERSEGHVSWSVVKFYFQAGGNLFLFITLPLVFCACQAIQTGSDFFLADWSNKLSNGDNPSTGAELGGYAALAFGVTLATTLRTYGVSVFSIRASRVLHSNLAQSVLRRTMSWFDRTPCGRITNRFTRDLGAIDTTIAVTIAFTIAPALSVLGVIIVIAILVPITLVVMVPLLPLILLVAHYYRKSNIELRRLESVSRSPVFVHFAEMLNGCVTIRALGAQQHYINQNNQRIDLNARPYYYTRAVNAWMRIRLDLIAALVVGASSALAVYSMNGSLGTLDPGSFGLLLSYALSLVSMLTLAVTAYTMAETAMNSVERIQAYSAPTNHEKWEATNARLSESVQGGGWPSKGRVQLKGLQMRYRDDLDLVLRGVDLDIKGGSRVGIVGRTGSGQLLSHPHSTLQHPHDAGQPYVVRFSPANCLFSAFSLSHRQVQPARGAVPAGGAVRRRHTGGRRLAARAVAGGCALSPVHPAAGGGAVRG